MCECVCKESPPDASERSLSAHAASCVGAADLGDLGDLGDDGLAVVFRSVERLAALGLLDCGDLGVELPSASAAAP